MKNCELRMNELETHYMKKPTKDNQKIQPNRMDYSFNFLLKFLSFFYRIVDELIHEVTREYQDANSDKK